MQVLICGTISFKYVTKSVSCLSSKHLQNLLAVYMNTRLAHDQINGIIKILHHNNRHFPGVILELSEREKFCSKFWISLYILYILTSACIKGSWESETPKNCPGTSENQCQEVWDSQLLKIFSHL